MRITNSSPPRRPFGFLIKHQSRWQHDLGHIEREARRQKPSEERGEVQTAEEAAGEEGVDDVMTHAFHITHEERPSQAEIIHS